MAHIGSDLMLMALLVKGIEIIDNESATEHERLRGVFESEIKTIKTRLGNVLPPVHEPKTNKSKLSADDKQFIMDEMMNIIGGKLGGTQTWESKTSPSSKFSSQFLGDFLSSVMKHDWDAFDEDEQKKDVEEHIVEKKKNQNKIINNNKMDTLFKPISWHDDINE